jgi:hypothetical protein
MQYPSDIQPSAISILPSSPDSLPSFPTTSPSVDLARPTAGFDAEFYSNAYPDVVSAVRNGEFSSAEQHWLLYGQAEGRLPQSPQDPPADAEEPDLDPLTGQLPLNFTANRGQTHPDVKFQVNGAGQNIYFTPEAIAFVTATQGQNDPVTGESEPLTSVVQLRFAGANSDPAIAGIDPLPGIANFIGANPASPDAVQAPTYEGIVYQDLYDGIDLVYRGGDKELKSEFIVDPGVDPGAIAFNYDGAIDLKLREDGALILETPLGSLIERAPIAYQDINGDRVPVASAYQLLDNGGVGFELGEYDRDYALIVDPTLEYSSYLGGTGQDRAEAIATDSQGNAYIAGSTLSLDFPAFVSFQSQLAQLQDAPNLQFDAFVTKIAADGSGFVYSTYLGGTGDDRAFDLAVDNNGDPYIVGQTSSPDFPLQTAIQENFNQGTDGFITKLTNQGALLVFSTYWGGSQNDAIASVALDGGGNAYVTGTTTSDNFPLFNAVQGAIGGGSDAFVSKFSPTGNFLYSSYLGGFDNDRGEGIAVDNEQNIYVTGQTAADNFPLVGEFQRRFAGGGDAFITKIAAEGTSLVYSSYLGGRDSDIGKAIAVDEEGHAYIVGRTGVPREIQPGAITGLGDFPTANAFQNQLQGSSDIFVTKVAPDGSGLVYSTFVGGSGFETANDMALGEGGQVYFVGETTSGDLPTRFVVQPSFGGNSDAFAGKLSPAGNDLEFLTYIGGSGFDTGEGIAIGPQGFNAYVAGQTASNNFPLVNPLQGDFGGPEGDAFVAKLAEEAPPPPPGTPQPGAPQPGTPAQPTPPPEAPPIDPAPPQATFESLVQLVATNALSPVGIFFDEGTYLNRYADIAEAVNAGLFASGLAHYLEFGQFEGRDPSNALYSEAGYLEANPDIAAAVAAGTFVNGFAHFTQLGFFEGRDRRSQLFNERFYLDENPDVANSIAIGQFNSGFDHFIERGQSERRNPNGLFDQTYYLSQNPDAAVAVSTGVLPSAFAHFILIGEAEGRSPTPLFDEPFYLRNNPDVNRAVRDGVFRSAYEHFLRFGRDEGRPATIVV